MSNTNYSNDYKGARLLSAKKAWVKTKNGKYKLNPDYTFVGKIDLKMPNTIVTTVQNKKPTYKGDVNNINNVAKKQMVEYFYNDNGKRNRRTVAYLVKNKKGKHNEKTSKKAK